MNDDKTTKTIKTVVRSSPIKCLKKNVPIPHLPPQNVVLLLVGVLEVHPLHALMCYFRGVGTGRAFEGWRWGEGYVEEVWTVRAEPHLHTTTPTYFFIFFFFYLSFFFCWLLHFQLPESPAPASSVFPLTSFVIRGARHEFIIYFIISNSLPLNNNAQQ